MSNRAAKPRKAEDNDEMKISPHLILSILDITAAHHQGELPRVLGAAPRVDRWYCSSARALISPLHLEKVPR